MNTKQKLIWKEFFKLKKEEIKFYLREAPINLLSILIIIAALIGVAAVVVGLILLMGWIHVTYVGIIYAISSKTLADLYLTVGYIDLIFTIAFGLIAGFLGKWLHNNWVHAVQNVEFRLNEKSGKK
jgi:hypothetical protein